MSEEIIVSLNEDKKKVKFKNLNAQEIEDLRKQAIQAETRRVEKIHSFLERLPLTNDVNKAVALELATNIAFIEQDIDRLESINSNTEDYELVWQGFWKKICAPTGRLNLTEVKKELADYKDLMNEVPKVYNEFTPFSKPHTRAKCVIDAINERMIDKQVAFDDLTMGAKKGLVIATVEELKRYFDIK